MRNFLIPAVAATALVLTACGGRGDDALGDNAADAAEAQAENLEAMADNSTGAQADALEQQAEATEDAGERREEAIDESDVDASRLSDGQKNALVNGQ